MDSDPAPRIVHLLNSLDRGGTERTLVALLRALGPGHEAHDVLTLRHAGPLSGDLPEHVACRALQHSGPNRWAFVSVARYLRDRQARVLHARNRGSWADAILATWPSPGTRLVLSHHGLQVPGSWSLRDRFIARLGLRLGARFLTVSDHGAAELRNELGIPEDRLNVIRNGVDLERFPIESLQSESRRRVRRTLGVGDETLVVGAVGSLIPVKGHALLIEAWSELARNHRKLHLMILGGGPLRGELERRIRQAGLVGRVTMMGVITDVSPLLPAWDIYVCASASEELSNALLEAMAAGLAVVTTDVGDHGQVIRDGTDGLVVAPGSKRALVRALSRLYKDPTLRRRLSAAARRRASEFPFRNVVETYRALYWNLTRNPAESAMVTAPRHARASRSDKAGCSTMCLDRSDVRWVPLN